MSETHQIQVNEDGKEIEEEEKEEEVVEVEEEDEDQGVGSIKDYLVDLFKDERLEVASVKNQERGETEIIKKEQMVNKLDRQNKMNNVAKLLNELSWDERFEWVHQQKIKGNRLFKKDEYQKAIDIYLQGLMGIEFQNPDADKQKRMEQENILPLLTNLATTLIKLKKFENASSVCNQVLKLDSESIKGNCKKGESLMYCRQYDEAVVYLKKSLKLAQKGQDKINIYRIYKKLQVMRKNEQNVYKQMFPPSEQSSRNEQELNQLIKDKCNSNNLNQDEYNFVNNISDDEEEREGNDDDDDYHDNSDEDSCDEDEYGYEQRKSKNYQGSKYRQQQKIKVLEFNDQLETLKQYIGPLSVLMVYPLMIYKKLASAVGCKRRKLNIQFESDSEDQNEEEHSNQDESSDKDD